MEKLKYLIISICLMLIFTFNVRAQASNFEAFIGMDADITENQIRIALGFSGEEIMTIKQTMTYDSRQLTLVDIEEMDNFNITTSTLDENGNYRTINILADSNYSFNESYYAVVVFEVNSSFRNNKKSDVFFYNYTASGPEKLKYRYSGLIATLNRLSISEMSYVTKNITNTTKTKYWFINHFYIFVLGFIGIILIVIILLLLPSTRKKERRDKNVQDLLRPENYDPNASNIKIDQKAIDQIGKVEKKVDMSQAIIVNEDVKPFGDIVGKFDSVQQTPPKEIENKNEFQDNNINVFENRSPDAFNDTTVNEEVKEVVPQNENATVDNGIDTFNKSPETSNTNNQQDDLFVIQPQTFEEVEMPKLSEVKLDELQNNIDEDLEVLDTNDNNNDNNNNNNNNFIVAILFMLSLSILSLSNVFADSIYRVDELRDNIVNGGEYDASLDYNEDGVIDLLDLIETKDLTNCNFDNLLSSDPGFAEIHGQSNNLISTDVNFEPATKKRTTRKTTTKKNGTTKKATTKGAGTTKANTTKKGATTKKTTTVKITTKKGATTKKTTTKKTTTAKTTTTKKTTTAAPTYQVSIQATNGSVSQNSFSLKAGSSTTITLMPNEGYVVDTNNSKCTNIDYSFSGSSKLVLRNPTSNASCNITYVIKSDIMVTLNYYTGSGNSVPNSPRIDYGIPQSENNGGKGVYNTKWTYKVNTPVGYQLHGAPSCGSYSNGTFSITVPSSNTTCDLYFDPILYKFELYVDNNKVNLFGTFVNIFYNEDKEFSFPSHYSTYTRVNCTGGKSATLRKENVGSNYIYYFNYKHTTTGNATCYAT